MPWVMPPRRSAAKSLALRRPSLTAAVTRSPSISTSSGSSASGSIETDSTVWSPLTLAVTTPPPAVPSTTSSASWAWVSSISRCIFCSCLSIWLGLNPPPLGMPIPLPPFPGAPASALAGVVRALLDDLPAELLGGPVCHRAGVGIGVHRAALVVGRVDLELDHLLGRGRRGGRGRRVGLLGTGVLADHHPDPEAAAEHRLEHAVDLPAAAGQGLGLELPVPRQLDDQLAALEGDRPAVAEEAGRDPAGRLHPFQHQRPGPPDQVEVHRDLGRGLGRAPAGLLGRGLGGR